MPLQLLARARAEAPAHPPIAPTLPALDAGEEARGAATESDGSAGRWRAANLAAATLAVAIRAALVLRADFPLNDGGLFYVMVRDLQANGYRLPERTSYNAAGLPFAYPPLSFYLAGLTEDLIGVPLLTLLRLLPLLWSLLALLAFWRLAEVALPGRAARTGALFAFAVLSNVYEWPLMGGGLARGLGLACALLALGECWRCFAGGARWHGVVASLAAAATILSHPNAAWFAAYSALFLAVAVGRSRRALLRAVAVGGGAAALAAPWWLTTLARHGRAAIPSGISVDVPLYGGVLRTALLAFTKEPFFAAVAGLALLGLLACLGRRRLVLPLWFLLASVLEPRAIDQLGALVALLAGVGVADILLPLLLGRWHAPSEDDPQAAPRPFRRRTVSRLALPLLAYVAFVPLVFGGEYLRPLSPDERAAIGWVATGTPPGARLLVLSGARSWESDRVSEWLPALSGRRSVATPQGYEWGGDLYARTAAHRDAQGCLAQPPDCLDAWAARSGEAFDYLYVDKAAPALDDAARAWGVRDVTAPFRAQLERDARWSRAYDGPAAAIYRRVAP